MLDYYLLAKELTQMLSDNASRYIRLGHRQQTEQQRSEVGLPFLSDCWGLKQTIATSAPCRKFRIIQVDPKDHRPRLERPGAVN